MKPPLSLRWRSPSHYHTALLTPDLFGGWVLVTTSGKREQGSGRLRQQPLASYEQGLEAVRRLRHRRRLEGCAVPDAGFLPLDHLDRHDDAVRGAESDALTRMFLAWGLSQEEQSGLLGIDERHVAELLDGQPLPEQPELLTRAGHLLAVNKSLRLRFGADRQALRDWLRQPRKELGQRSALEVMLASPGELALLRGHLARECDLARGCPRKPV